MSLSAGLTNAAEMGVPANRGGGSIVDEGRQHTFSPIVSLLRCPVDGAELIWHGAPKQLTCAHGTHTFPVEADIPRVFASNEWSEGKRDVTDNVKHFYENVPVPNYDGLELQGRPAAQGCGDRIQQDAR